MNNFYIPGHNGIELRASRDAAIEWLTGLYGENPAQVGTIDGTEDDFGDMISADLPYAILGDAKDSDEFDLDTCVDRLGDALDGVTSWSEALDITREVVA